MALLSLTQRRFQPELMDQPDARSSEHRQALDGLRRLNIASRACRQLWREIAAQTGVESGQRLRILDVASGGGDVALGLWTIARRRGVELQILGLDISATACEQASQRCRGAGKSITFMCADVIRNSLPNGFDVVMSSLFLHHLSREQAVRLLSRMGAAGQLLIVSDLRRSAVGYVVACAACRVVTRSPIVRHDGPQSVANAFTLAEMGGICRAARLHGAVVRRAWPWRLLVTRPKS